MDGIFEPERMIYQRASFVFYIRPFIVLIQICKAKTAAKSKPFVVSLLPPSYYPFLVTSDRSCSLHTVRWQAAQLLFGPLLEILETPRLVVALGLLRELEDGRSHGPVGVLP